MPAGGQSNNEGHANLSDKEKFDALMKLAEFRMEMRSKRQQLQLRMTAALWAALAGAIYLKARPPDDLLLLVLAVVVLGHAAAVARAATAHARDGQYARHYSGEAENIVSGLDNPNQRPTVYAKLPLWQRWVPPTNELLWVAAWISPTVILALSAYVLSGKIAP